MKLLSKYLARMGWDEYLRQLAPMDKYMQPRFFQLWALKFRDQSIVPILQASIHGLDLISARAWPLVVCLV
jgi:hypothetical protein